MVLDVLGLLEACSYALDCVEAELVHVSDRHAKRVAYMSVCTAQQLGIHGESLQDLAACALLHDNALTQYIQEELHNDIAQFETAPRLPGLGIHCTLGEKNIAEIPFHTDVKNVILYHHEIANGSGPFGKTWEKTETFLAKVKGTIVDEECVEAFLGAFTEAQFLTLGEDSFEKSLWERIPRIKQELSFTQIKELARFFAQIVDYKSPFTSTHSIGVAEDAEQLSRYMGFDEETVQKMYLAGALHDIGKVAVDNEILEKPGRLTEDEFAVMKHHAAYTYRILSGVDDFDEIRDWAAFHHERLDGTGYPFGKIVAELNTQERMMACIDIYQALNESRPYKQGMPHEQASEILWDMANKGWLDETIVKQVEDCFRG